MKIKNKNFNKDNKKWRNNKWKIVNLLVIRIWKIGLLNIGVCMLIQYSINI
jgi:hypothetical protein